MLLYIYIYDFRCKRKSYRFSMKSLGHAKEPSGGGAGGGGGGGTATSSLEELVQNQRELRLWTLVKQILGEEQEACEVALYAEAEKQRDAWWSNINKDNRRRKMKSLKQLQQEIEAKKQKKTHSFAGQLQARKKNRRIRMKLCTNSFSLAPWSPRAWVWCTRVDSNSSAQCSQPQCNTNCTVHAIAHPNAPHAFSCTKQCLLAIGLRLLQVRLEY